MIHWMENTNYGTEDHYRLWTIIVIQNCPDTPCFCRDGWLFCVAHYNYHHPRGVSGQGGISDYIRVGTSLKRLMAPHLLRYSRGQTKLGACLRDVYSGGDDILCCRPQVSPRPWQHLTVTTFFCLLTSRITMLLSSTDRRGRTLLLFCTVLVQSVVSSWSLKNVVWWIFDMKTDIKIRPRQDWSLWCLKIYLYCFYLMHFLLMHVSAL